MPSAECRHCCSSQTAPWCRQVRVGGRSEWVDVFMTTDADHSESVRCYMFLLQSRIFRDRTRGSIYQHLWRALLTKRWDGLLRQHGRQSASSHGTRTCV